MWSKRKKNPAMATTEIIEWMQKHTIGDLKDIASRTERSGGDATSVKRLLTDLEELRAETVGVSEMSLALDEFRPMPR